MTSKESSGGQRRPSTKPPEAVPQKPGRQRFPSRLRKLLVALIGLIFLGAVLYATRDLWVSLIRGPQATGGVEACSPTKPTEDFQPANKSNLEGEIQQDSYFKGGEDYTVAANAALVIPQGVTLIIEPGTRIKFGEGAKMVVEGKLLACGRGNRPILFTADTSSGQPGFWLGLEIRNADVETVVGHARFEFAGKGSHAPIWVEGTDAHLEDLHFDSNLWYPLSFDPDSYPRLIRPFEVENGPQGWEMRGGEMKTDQSWADEQPFIINGVFEIAQDAGLSIATGSWVKFTQGSVLRVYGELNAPGTQNKPIKFTSTNEAGEENAPKPAAGDWIGLQFIGRKSKAVLENVEVRYAGAESQERGCLWLSDAAPVFRNITVSDCAAYALSTDLASEATIEKITLQGKEVTSRWELRESKLQGVTTRTLSPLFETDGSPIYPVVTGWIGAEADASLIISPDMVLLFAGGDKAGMWAEGKLQIGGSKREPIVLTSWRDPQYNPAGGAQAGDWGGLQLNNNKAEDVHLSQVSLRYAGAAEKGCLLLSNAAPKIQNMMITECAAYPISSDAASRPQFDGLDISANRQANQWEIRESSLKEHLKWEWEPTYSKDNSQVIRIVTGVVTIEPEASLELKPALILKFTSGKGLVARGVLLAEGTEKQPILLTSWRDPEGGGSEGGPQPGDWGGVVLEGSGAVKKLEYIRLHYAGAPNNGIGCLNLKESNPSISNLEISYCDYYPITSDLASEPLVEGLVMRENRPANEWAMRESRLQKGQKRTWDILSQADGGGNILRTAVGWLTVEGEAQLTLGPGVVLKFQNGVGLQAGGGRLSLQGSSDNPVILTSWRDPQWSNEGGVKSGDWAGLSLEGVQGDSQLQYVEVRYAGGNHNPRGAITLTEASPLLENLKISDAAWYPVSLDLASNPKVQQVTFINNSPANAIEVRGSRLESVGEQVWSPWYDAANQPLIRVVMNTLTVGEQATLKIESGTVVKFDTSAGLDIFGGLLADDVVLTSLYDDYGGDASGGVQGENSWIGIMIHGRRPARLENSLVRYAQTGVWMENAAPTLTNTRIENSREAALSADFLSLPNASSLTLANNAVNGLLLREDRLPASETRWTLIGTAENHIVRVVDKALLVGDDARLVIEPGVVIKFKGGGGLSVDGELKVEGNSGARVYFTSFEDDSVGGDTDNLAQTPRRGSWLGIAANPNKTDASLTLFFVDIRYAINGLYLTDLLTWGFDGLVISNSQYYGISCDTLSSFDPADARIALIDNGSESFLCPTPDRQEAGP